MITNNSNSNNKKINLQTMIFNKLRSKSDDNNNIFTKLEMIYLRTMRNISKNFAQKDRFAIGANQFNITTTDL